MNKGLNPHKTGLSVAITAEIISMACLILVAVLPKRTMLYITNSITHSLNFESMMTASITLQSAIAGFVALGILAYASGVIFAFVYNKLK